MIEKNEESYKDNKICRFCEEEFSINKVRDHCHLTGS